MLLIYYFLAAYKLQLFFMNFDSDERNGIYFVGWLVVWGFTTVPVTKTIRLSEWVTPGDTAIPGMTSLKDGDLHHSSALAQSPKEI